MYPATSSSGVSEGDQAKTNERTSSVGLVHIFDVQRPHFVFGLRERDAIVPSDHLVMNGEDGLLLVADPAHL